MSFDLKIKNGDLSIVNGSLKTIIDTDKLAQDLLKIVLTPAGSNPLFPWYGSFISQALIGSSLDTSITLQIAKDQIQKAIENLKELQQAQLKSGQQVSADEQIAFIGDISINKNIDPRIFDVKIRVNTKGFKPLTTSFQIDII